MNQNVLPLPGSLCTPIVPPIISTISFEIVVPSPVPPNRRVIDSSACVNRSKMRRCASAEMPMPVSTTSNRTVASLGVSDSRVTRTPTSPFSVNFKAFPRRFNSTCRSRSGSPRRRNGTLEGTRRKVASPLNRAWGSTMATVCFTIAYRSKSFTSTETFPASIFDRSRTSCIRNRRVCAESSIVFVSSSCSAESGVPFSRSSIPMIPLSGVRISWLMFARNRVFARLASSARFPATVSFFRREDTYSGKHDETDLQADRQDGVTCSSTR